MWLCLRASNQRQRWKRLPAWGPLWSWTFWRGWDCRIGASGPLWMIRSEMQRLRWVMTLPLSRFRRQSPKGIDTPHFSFFSRLFNLSDGFLYNIPHCPQTYTYQFVFLCHVRADVGPLNVQLPCVFGAGGVGACQVDCLPLGLLNGLWPRRCHLHRPRHIWWVRKLQSDLFDS